MSRKTLLTLAVLTALSSATAFAATQSDTTATAKPQRAGLDLNGDGAIDRSEAAKSPRLTEKFAQLDADKDGKLTRQEMPRHGDRKHGRNAHGPRQGGGDFMAKLDTDKDSRISRAEAAAGQGRLATRFEQMDVNKDGFIDRADHQLRARQRTDQWFARVDTDKDGKLSRAEVDASRASQGERGPRHRQPAAVPAK